MIGFNLYLGSQPMVVSSDARCGARRETTHLQPGVKLNRFGAIAAPNLSRSNS
jgi:hypothetical protein